MQMQDAGGGESPTNGHARKIDVCLFKRHDEFEIGLSYWHPN